MQIIRLNKLKGRQQIILRHLKPSKFHYYPIIQIAPYDQITDCTELNKHKLLFKRKDETYIGICEKFSKPNAQLLCANRSYSLEQASRLIEDMFYAEYIYEKLSVYAEYIQTWLQKDASNLKIMT